MKILKGILPGARADEAPTSGTGAAPDRNVWEKWYWWSHYALYGFLALATLMALLAAPSLRTLTVGVPVTGLFAVWHWYFQGSSPE